MIEKAKKGISHPKNDLLKNMTPSPFFFKYFFFKLINIMIDKAQNGVSQPKNYLLIQNHPTIFFVEKYSFLSNFMNIMIEKAQNGVSHPKNDFFKKMTHPKFCLIFFNPFIPHKLNLFIPQK